MHPIPPPKTPHLASFPPQLPVPGYAGQGITLLPHRAGVGYKHVLREEEEEEEDLRTPEKMVA